MPTSFKTKFVLFVAKKYAKINRLSMTKDTLNAPKVAVIV